MLALHTLTVLVSATLLFLVQPMFARMILPLLGGSPAVWNTALVFYQLVLLAGYAYAHYATARLGVRKQSLLHAGLVLIALVSLPIALPHGWSPPTDHTPIPWMFALLTVGIGLPFFVVSTTGPLMQKWFATTRHRAAGDPYFLYAASNVGSMVGLLGYPLLIEPRLRLGDQSALWSAGYGLLAALVIVCAVVVRRATVADHSVAPARVSTVEGAAAASARPLGADVLAPDRITTRRKLHWMLLAFVPSSLMIGVTNHLSTDIAAIPLLWVVPLALYLLSFILVFASRPPIPHALMVRALPLVALPLAVVLQARVTEPLLMVIGIHLLMLFVAAMVCHGELAADRPSPEHLTQFYLWLAVGGAIGGAFNALLAPVLFHTIVEYPIAIVIACFLVPPRRPVAPDRTARIMDFALPGALAVLILLFVVTIQMTGLHMSRLAIMMFMGVLAFPLMHASRRPLRFGLGMAVALLLSPAALTERTRVLHEERGFFGVNRVIVDDSRRFNQLIHGTTVHGMQRVQPRGCNEPIGYYHREGPLGDVFRAKQQAMHKVAVAGLGAGGTAAYARPGEQWTYYEIDPAVERIATDSTYFCYLRECRGDARVVLGDARLSLARTNDRYDLIVLDAYSSDAIPVHLLTREALQLYTERLAPGGFLVFHLSNRYFRLVPVVARLADDARLVCRVRSLDNVPEKRVENDRLIPSTYAVVARRESDLGALASDTLWRAPKVRPEVALWTDDFSSLLSVLR